MEKDDLARELDFEGVLAELLGRVGSRVCIDVGDCDERGPPLVMCVVGTLAGGTTVSSYSGHGEAIFFHLGEQPESGVFLNPAHFKCAAIELNGDLSIDLGGVRVVVAPAPQRVGT